MADVEIAICTHNRAKELDLCLDVLGRQTAARNTWNVLVIDNASTDHTPEVVQRHARTGRLPGLRRVFEGRPGLTSARQCALREASADYVAFVDDDCHLAPDWIEQLQAARTRFPDAAGFGGRVRPNWRPDIPDALRAHGWIFAEQPHGRPDAEGRVDSLVGAGLVIDRNLLIQTGWVDQPLIEDRIGRGSTSGGDVEMGIRLREAGGYLVYVPDMELDHMIDPARQTLAKMLELSAGLGAGAAFVSILESDKPDEALLSAAARECRHRKRQLLMGMVRRHLSVVDWRIYRAFENGRLDGLRRLETDKALFTKLSERTPRR